MEANEQYRDKGYAVLPGFLPAAIAKAVVDQVMQDAMVGDTQMKVRETSKVLVRKTFQLHSSQYTPLRTMHWGLTPMLANLAGQDLAPTYALFRIYGRGDICRVHGDSPACEHSISLMLGSEGGIPWSLDLATDPTPRGFLPPEDDFGGADYVRTLMNPGDAVLYRGVTQRHGRTTPNPNSWSAHLFLHWVAQDGPYAERATPGPRAA